MVEALSMTYPSGQHQRFTCSAFARAIIAIFNPS
jgi:hypothetical protein